MIQVGPASLLFSGTTEMCGERNAENSRKLDRTVKRARRTAKRYNQASRYIQPLPCLSYSAGPLSPNSILIFRVVILTLSNRSDMSFKHFYPRHGIADDDDEMFTKR